MSILSQHFASRLKEFREGKGLTQGDLASEVGVSQQRVSEWERCARTPRFSTVEDLAAALKVDPREFFR